MAKQKAGEELVDNIKFVSLYPRYHIVVKTGKERTDAKGNNPVAITETYHFTTMVTKDAKGVTQPNKTVSFFLVSRELLGDMFDKVHETLLKMRNNPMNYLYLEADYRKLENPVAFAAQEEVSIKDAVIKQQADTIADLKKKLGIE
jgi:hypothetical protein